jgi:K+-transporting ATPase KdpF subunit
MARRSGGIFRDVRRRDLVYRTFANGGMNVDWTITLALVVTGGLAVYLVLALLNPERFS